MSPSAIQRHTRTENRTEIDFLGCFFGEATTEKTEKIKSVAEKNQFANIETDATKTTDFFENPFG